MCCCTQRSLARAAGVVSVALTLLTQGGVTRAQSTGASTADGEPAVSGDAAAGALTDRANEVPAALQPPVLREQVQAEYPAAALAQRLHARVVLRLSIDATGRVTDAELVEPAGHGFDEAAIAAVLQFAFEPARRGDTPIKARILYAYAFTPPVQEPAPAVLPVPVLAPAAAPVPVSHAQAVDVTVQGHSRAERLQASARAVEVIDTAQAQHESADLGEVLARTAGVGVRRGGGLGSTTRFSLDGLTDDQIRFFVDGVPMEMAGYPLGIANVPVNLVQRVDIYRGVVPVHFGSDALGGAVNVVTDDRLDENSVAASFQAGSFGTRRATSSAQMVTPERLFVRGSVFYDYADNDYPIDVEVPDARGRLAPARVYRFHDAYNAGGGTLEAGVVDKAWADLLAVRAFVASYDKQLQNNVVMKVPYGEPEYGELSAGGSARYKHRLAGGVTLDGILGYTRSRTYFVDEAECVYNWFGQCVRDRAIPGETDVRPHDQLLWDNSGYGRFNLGWQLAPKHRLRFSVSPTYVTRTGDERAQLDPDARDPLTAQRDLFTMVSGAEYQIDVFDARLENIAFAKNYVQRVRSEEPLPGGLFRDADRDTLRFGAGDSLRYRFTDFLYAKLSYEYATRLPRPDEIFGDGALIHDNLELDPEVSHNGNLGATLELSEVGRGELRVDVTGFVRDASELVVLLGNDRFFTYQNVYTARSLGADLTCGWTSFRDYVALEANVTYVDYRNTSDEGTFADFEGDRIPNRPYLFSNATTRFTLHELASARDQISLAGYMRYVHEFFRGWESVGLREFKQVIPSQLLFSIALTYLVEGDAVDLGFTAEVDNLTDQKAFDFYGVQRPGRAFYFKVTAEL